MSKAMLHLHVRSSPRPRRLVRTVQLMGLVLLISALGGCNVVGWAAHGIAGDMKQKVRVTADYDGLQNQDVAVLVGADSYILFRYPNVQLDVNRAISARLVSAIEGITVSDPTQVYEFQMRHSYWNTLPYGQLLEQLEVDRIVLVDLVDYSTHEPGNRHLWRGVASANVSVASAEAADPNNLVYATTVKVTYPPRESVGVLDSDDATIQLGMLTLLAQKVGWLFHDHKEIRE